MASKPKYRDNYFIWDIKDLLLCALKHLHKIIEVKRN